MKYLNITHFRISGITLKLIILIFFVFIDASPEKESVYLYREFNAPPGRDMVFFYSGDGGWRDFSIHICNFLQKHNIPAFGVNTLSYFWEYRTPKEMAGDFEKNVIRCRKKWQTQKVILIGYSFGADVIPAMVNQLSNPLKNMIDGIILIAPSPYAQFEIKIINLISDPHDGRALLPDLENIKNIPIYFICDNTENSLAPLLDNRFDHITLPGGHHFHYDYDTINALILHKIKKFTTAR